MKIGSAWLLSKMHPGSLTHRRKDSLRWAAATHVRFWSGAMMGMGRLHTMRWMCTMGRHATRLGSTVHLHFHLLTTHIPLHILHIPLATLTIKITLHPLTLMIPLHSLHFMLMLKTLEFEFQFTDFNLMF